MHEGREGPAAMLRNSRRKWTSSKSSTAGYIQVTSMFGERSWRSAGPSRGARAPMPTCWVKWRAPGWRLPNTPTNPRPSSPRLNMRRSVGSQRLGRYISRRRGRRSGSVYRVHRTEKRLLNSFTAFRLLKKGIHDVSNR